VGAANVLNAGPKWLAIPVAIFDIGKGALVVFIAKQIGLSALQQATVGLFAIVGHDWPVYLSFKSGGRGVFVSLGVIAMLSWKMGLIALIFPYLLAPIKQVSLGVFLVFVSLPFLSYFLTGPLGVEDRAAITLGFIVLSTIALLKRMVARRTELSKNLPLAKVVFYRLLFDRDIADRQLWNARAIKNQG
jgi:glycerol-3-phosphate acyltransferase PlsY